MATIQKPARDDFEVTHKNRDGKIKPWVCTTCNASFEFSADLLEHNLESLHLSTLDDSIDADPRNTTGKFAILKAGLE